MLLLSSVSETFFCGGKPPPKRQNAFADSHPFQKVLLSPAATAKETTLRHDDGLSKAVQIILW